MAKYLYNLPLFEGAQSGESDDLGTQLSEQGILDSDEANVEAISNEAADLTLEGVYRFGEDISTVLADELEELADSSLRTLPLYRTDRRYSAAGYYEVEDLSVEPVHPRQPGAYSWTISLSKVGKPGSHLRVTYTNKRQIDHDFGNDLEGLVGVPASARKVRWLHPTDKSTEKATSVGTVPHRNGDIEQFDIEDGETAVNADTPALVYEIDFEDEVATGCRVYDTLGTEDKFDDALRQWQTVHSTDHQLRDPVVVSNGTIQLWLDDQEQTLKAEEWDPDSVVSATAGTGGYGDGVYGDGLYAGSASGQWVDVDLEQPEDVEVYDVNILEISATTDTAQVTFDVDDELFALDLTLARGLDVVLVEVPENESPPIPDDLEGWLEPIAAETVVDTQPSKGLVRRGDVAK